MEVIYHIKTDFPAVFLLNGVFCQGGDGFSYNAEEALYVTVLPLNAMLLPFTTKVLGPEVLENETLTLIYTLPDNHYVMKLSPRYNYVYSPRHKTENIENSIAARFFKHVKAGETEKARSLATAGLNEAIDDESLLSFFNDYCDVVENNFISSVPNTYFLIGNDHKGALFCFFLKGGKIDNLTEVEM